MIDIPERYTPKGNSANGGMSSVTVCLDERLQRDVVIKSLDPSVDQQRLLDEVQALQSIRSDYVVQIYDVVRDDDGDISALVEEYCAGTDLSDEIGAVDHDRFIRIGYQLISGIAEVHAHGVIHRDIKPHNVRVGALDRLTIIDFGLARSSGGAQTVSMIGTSGFMAPELFVQQADGSIAFTAAIDVFAFASSMLLLATGGLPKGLCKRPPNMNFPGIGFGNLPFTIDAALAAQLNGAFAPSAGHRPTAAALRDAFRKVLLRGRHRALLNVANKPQYLDAANPKATASLPGLADVIIEYDGDEFVVTSVSGDLYINAGKVSVGYRLPGSCVIAFGAPELQSKREYITFDVSHPGVEL